MQNLTPKQLQLLEWVEQYLSVHHTMPSRREMAEGLGLSSPATIQQHIEALEKKGFLKRGEIRESRALQWTARSKKIFSAIHTSKANPVSIDGSDPLPALASVSRIGSRTEDVGANDIPLLGSIAAGYPIEVFPETKRIAVPLELFVSGGKASNAEAAKKDYYLLTVRGDSMIDEGIFSGDLVLIKRTATAKTGDTVAALVNGEATLKRFVKAKGGVELHPANPKYPVFKVGNEDRFEIQGILAGVIRRFGSN